MSQKKKMPKRKPVVHPYAPKTSKKSLIPRKKVVEGDIVKK